MAKRPSLDVIAKRIQAAIEPTNREVRNFAASIAADSPGGYNIGQVILLWRKLRDGFRYVSDPRGLEYLVPASDNIDMGLVGDCDDAAILMASLIEAIGGASRVITASGVSAGHAYAECYAGKFSYLRDSILPYLRTEFPLMQAAYCHQDAVNGCWINMDTLGGQHPGSRLFDSDREYAIYPNGGWEAI